MEVRKYVTIVEETAIEGGKKVDPPTRKAAAIAVIKNPFAGKYVEKLDELIDIGEELGGLLGKKAVEALKIPPKNAESYGKAAIVGMDGELEHAAAILHPKLGTGKIKPGKTVLIETPSGQPGVGLAFVAAARGYKLMLVMPESMSIERRKILAHLGAELVLTPAAGGIPGATRNQHQR